MVTKMSKMFPFITATLNPIGGECQHKCIYCWATKLADKYDNTRIKYTGAPKFYEKEREKKKAPFCSMIAILYGGSDVIVDNGRLCIQEDL